MCSWIQKNHQNRPDDARTTDREESTPSLSTNGSRPKQRTPCDASPSRSVGPNINTKEKAADRDCWSSELLYIIYVRIYPGVSACTEWFVWTNLLGSCIYHLVSVSRICVGRQEEPSLCFSLFSNTQKSYASFVSRPRKFERYNDTPHARRTREDMMCYNATVPP